MGKEIGKDFGKFILYHFKEPVKNEYYDSELSKSTLKTYFCN